MPKKKANHLPSNMNPVERQRLLADFIQSHAGFEREITAEDLVLWAVNTHQWYDWFYTRFAAAVERHGFERMHENQTGLTFTPFEVLSAKYNDILSGLLRQRGGPLNLSVCRPAGRALYRYYYNHYLESLLCKPSPSSATEAPSPHAPTLATC